MTRYALASESKRAQAGALHHSRTRDIIKMSRRFLAARTLVVAIRCYHDVPAHATPSACKAMESRAPAGTLHHIHVTSSMRQDVETIRLCTGLLARHAICKRKRKNKCLASMFVLSIESQCQNNTTSFRTSKLQSALLAGHASERERKREMLFLRRRAHQIDDCSGKRATARMSAKWFPFNSQHDRLGACWLRPLK